MNTQDGSDECQKVAYLAAGYIQGLAEGVVTNEAREMLLDWLHLIEKSQQKNGDE